MLRKVGIKLRVSCTVFGSFLIARPLPRALVVDNLSVVSVSIKISCLHGGDCVSVPNFDALSAVSLTVENAVEKCRETKGQNDVAI